MIQSDSEALLEALIVTAQKRLADLAQERKEKLGRPRSTDRCPCGAMTAYRAAKRGHMCEEKETTE